MKGKDRQITKRENNNYTKGVKEGRNMNKMTEHAWRNYCLCVVCLLFDSVDLCLGEGCAART